MIVHSNFFKRLAKKTQVYSLPENDHVRNRLTHSIEVSQIGRQLARYLALTIKNNALIDSAVYPHFAADFEELTGAACLVHDVGHPPFGHSGAKILNHLLVNQYQLMDGFDDNKQVAHILLNEFLYEDLAPSACLVAATLKKTEINDCVYLSDSAALIKMLEYLELKNLRHPASILMEAADDIAYICSDLEDYISHFLQFKNLQILRDLATTLESVPLLDANYRPTKTKWSDLIEKIFSASNEENESKDNLVEKFRNFLMRAMVLHVMESLDRVVTDTNDLDSLPQMLHNFIKTHSFHDVHKGKSDPNLLYSLGNPNNSGETFYEVKRICYDEFILKQDKVIEQDLIANSALTELADALYPLCGHNYANLYEFKYLSQDMRSYLSFAHKNHQQLDPRRAVADYVAGMSDRFCLESLTKIRPVKIRRAA